MAEENKKRSNKEKRESPFPSKEESTCLAQC